YGACRVQFATAPVQSSSAALSQPTSSFASPDVDNDTDFTSPVGGTTSVKTSLGLSVSSRLLPPNHVIVRSRESIGSWPVHQRFSFVNDGEEIGVLAFNSASQRCCQRAMDGLS